MEIHDKLYGKFFIDSPLLLDLLKAPSVLRLKKICQYGIPDEFYHLKNTTRYDHSLGVMLLLRKLGASEEEQAAGLLHDVSHTAFSHLIDWLVGTGETEEFQDNQHEEYIMKSELVKILKKHGLNPRKIADHHRYPLLEQPIPFLCADRIDYSIKEYPLKLARESLKGLTVYKNKIVFNDLVMAKRFANEFLRRQIEHWADDEAVCRYIIFGDALKVALSEKVIKFDDFWKNDSYVVEKLKKSKNKQILGRLKILRKEKVANLKRTNKTVRKKFRYVDPLVLINGVTKRLSVFDKKFKKKIDKARKDNQKGVRIPIVEI